ncbi:putative O-succinylhomoserine (Thiol)-lyase [Venustampulla echinocandica]|uniref:cystathionine gamma-synthase n=1 Tax=Venustampulla echinocandica TaxID=2656787 RepID=A0A370TDG3_9HELO|nr:putative O-succinylhomoserine (Thiol)-lyase [Venustampulla echinocandica]RDL32496.1 putative O-succinylhomoserine (Thiol)-lyase [Venustampulla echinocandica]
MSIIELGESVPALTPHASSVSLPTWADNVGYEEGQARVLSKMTTGYPRFFIHKAIVAFAEDVVQRYGTGGQAAMLFPSFRTSRRCVNFMHSRDPSISPNQIQLVDLVLDKNKVVSESLAKISPSVSAVIFPKDLFSVAKQYWQHSGDGVSSRRAEFCHGLFREGILIDEKTLQPTKDNMNGIQKSCKGPRRYQKGSIDQGIQIAPECGTKAVAAQQSTPDNDIPEARESSQFLEERFGRNLDVSFVENAKLAIRRRIAGSLMGETDLAATPSLNVTSNTRGVVGLSDDDVYLHPCGMNAIFIAHQMLLEARGHLKSISFGFPYVDTLKILEKFGPGCLFYGNGSSEDLDDLEARLKAGEKFLALFCEFPGNPMLKSPDLTRIRGLADTYGFAVVVDETIGNFINVHVLPYADIVVSSLTKIFSGECNVMGGSAILNPRGPHYHSLKKIAEAEHEDNYWAEDVIFMERNSRHFVSRIERINENAELICSILGAHPLVKTVYYPKYNPSREFYDACRTPNGGYGGLLSFEFENRGQAIAFFDRIETAKGPSLGTNFTLVSPYVILAHFLELDWAAQFGVPADLIRISVGLEGMDHLKAIFQDALKAAEGAVS